MLKLRKIFSFGLLLAVAGLGLLVSSCDVEPKDTYTVTVTGGTGSSGSGTEYEEGDLVTIYAGTKADSVFSQWTSDSVSNVVFANDKSPTTTFTMPARNVSVKALWTAKNTVATYTIILYDGEDAYEEVYEEGETVEVEAFGPFAIWTAADASLEQINLNFANPTNRKTNFTMPAKDLWVLAYPTAVRYNWEAAEQSKIYMIMASEEDVNWWYDAVYYEQGYDKADDALLHISHHPLGDGSDMIPNNIYTNEAPANVTHKSKYYAIEEGNYTAICTVIDPEMKDTFDIVANYDIEEGTAMPYFGVGFDVALFLDPSLDPSYDPKDDPDPDTWVLNETFDGPATPSYLVKTKAKAAKFLKKIKKDSVTYYVFRRARK